MVFCCFLFGSGFLLFFVWFFVVFCLGVVFCCFLFGSGFLLFFVWFFVVFCLVFVWFLFGFCLVLVWFWFGFGSGVSVVWFCLKMLELAARKLPEVRILRGSHVKKECYIVKTS